MTWRTSVLALMVAAGLVALAAALDDRAEHLRIASPQLRAETNLPDSDVLRRGALGFHVLLSDLWWLQAIQYYGTMRNAGEQFRQLGPIMDVVVGLDPEFCYAYRFAGVAIPFNTGQGWVNTDAAKRILDKGIEPCPGVWQIPFLRGYNAFWYDEDMQTAAEHTARAAKLPGAPAFLPLLATRLYSHMGRLDVAIDYAQRVLESAEEPRVREEMAGRLLELFTERELRRIEAALAAWREERGNLPPSLAALPIEIAPEPRGGRWIYDPATGEVRSDRLKKRIRLGEFIFKQLEREAGSKGSTSQPAQQRPKESRE